MSTGHDDAGNSLRDIMKAGQRKLEAEQLEPLSQTHDMERMIADSRALFAKRCSGELKPIKLPFPKLGEALNGGLWPGLYFIIGHTGSGKSQLALQVGLKAAEEGTPVLYIGLELDGPQLLARLAGLVEKTRWSSFYYGKREVNPKTYASLKKLPIRLEMGKSFGWSYDRIGPVVAAMRKKHGKAPVVILDFLQLVQSPETEREDLRERIGKASYAARMAAKDHQASVLLISSVSRAHYQKMVTGGIHKDGTPKMPAGELVGTGKESGETEFSADAVLVLTSDAKAGRMQLEKNYKSSWVWVAIAKQRGGQKGWFPLTFNGGWFTEPTAEQRDIYKRKRSTSGDSGDTSGSSTGDGPSKVPTGGFGR